MFSAAEWETFWAWQKDEVFLTLTAILASTAALVCLVVAWATTSRCHWFWRASAVLAVLGFFVPPRAFEPLLFFALVAAFQGAGVYLLRRYRPSLLAPLTGDSPQPVARRWSFQIRDLLLLMILIGFVLAAVPVFRSQQLQAKWGHGIWAALGVALIGVCAMVMACRPQIMRNRLALAIAIVFAAAQQRWLCGDYLEIDTYYEFTYSSFSGADIVLLLQRYILFACLLMSGLAVMRVLAEPTMSLRKRAAIVAVAGCLSLFAIAPAGWIYWQLSRPLPAVSTLHFANNPFPRIETCAIEMERINPSGLTANELRKVAGARAAQQVSNINGELLDLLATPGHVPMESLGDATFSHFKFDHLQTYRLLARVWSGESKEAANAGQADVACRYARATIQFGGDLTRGGAQLHALVGFPVEASGMARLAEVHRDISLAEIRRTLKSLEQRQSLQELPNQIKQRDRILEEMVFGWRTRLHNAIHDLWARDPGITLDFVFQRANVHSNLLRISLALRLFEHDHGSLPQSLSELAPDYLREIPLDGYSNQPFVYRIKEEGHLLYSVGPDGVDNGGNFGASYEVLKQSGFDVDVDASSR